MKNVNRPDHDRAMANRAPQPSWKVLRRNLAERSTVRPAPRPADAFWDEFQTRARLRTPRQTPAPKARFLTVPASSPWMTAGALAACLLLAAGIVWFPRPSAGGQENMIRSFNVVAPHAAVIILRDQSADGTLLWIVDMELPAENGDTV